ncbi:hypothetical protein FRC12_022755 [Ceratobasidium sp. 428]|nr:hypothetical protein FRC12_022755 [Ceratobasidium sp. 428]
MDDWTTLLPLIESQWPTPSQDTDTYKERNWTRFGKSYLDTESMAKALNDCQNPSRLHQIWAKQHLAKGKACDSMDKDHVHHTIKCSLPRVVIPILQRSPATAQISTACAKILAICQHASSTRPGPKH